MASGKPGCFIMIYSELENTGALVGGCRDAWARAEFNR